MILKISKSIYMKGFDFQGFGTIWKDSVALLSGLYTSGIEKVVFG